MEEHDLVVLRKLRATCPSGWLWFIDPRWIPTLWLRPWKKSRYMLNLWKTETEITRIEEQLPGCGKCPSRKAFGSFRWSRYLAPGSSMLNPWALGAGDSTSNKSSKLFKNFSRSRIACKVLDFATLILLKVIGLWNLRFWIWFIHIHQLFLTPTWLQDYKYMSIQAAKGRIPCASITWLGQDCESPKTPSPSQKVKNINKKVVFVSAT